MRSADRYNDQLLQVSDYMIEMGDLAGSLIVLAKNSIMNNPTSDTSLLIADNSLFSIEKKNILITEANQRDSKLQQLGKDIVSLVIHILSTRQPMAVDLREVCYSLKIASYIEGIAGIARNIVQKTEKPFKVYPKPLEDDLLNLATMLSNMLYNVLLALKDNNYVKALEVLAEDDNIDALYYKFYLLAQREMKKDPEMVSTYSNLITIAKGFERIGDHISRISKAVKYIYSAE